MKDFLTKLSSYNFFNYLFPGVIFAYLGSKITRYSCIQEDLVVGAFVYYFIGLVVSRFGSLVIEPVLRAVSFVKFGDYEDYVAACKKDEKTDLFSEINNSYRTLVSVFLLILLLKAYESFEAWSCFLTKWNTLILIVLLLATFLFSYRKQTAYISKRVKITTKEAKDGNNNI